MSETTVILDPVVMSAVVGVVIPILTGVITKLRASTGTKAIVAIFLSVIAGALSEIVAGGGTFDPRTMALATASAFVANVASYLGVWQPIGSTRDVPLARATAEYGIG